MGESPRQSLGLTGVSSRPGHREDEAGRDGAGLRSRTKALGEPGPEVQALPGS